VRHAQKSATDHARPSWIAGGAFRSRTTPGYSKAVVWFRISIGLFALLVVEVIVGVSLRVGAFILISS
jgi:hypothetical protein